MVEASPFLVHGVSWLLKKNKQDKGTCDHDGAGWVHLETWMDKVVNQEGQMQQHRHQQQHHIVPRLDDVHLIQGLGGPRGSLALALLRIRTVDDFRTSCFISCISS